MSSNAVGRTVARIASATGAYEHEHDGHDQSFELKDLHTRSRYPLVTRERTSSSHFVSIESDSHEQVQTEKYSQPGEKSGQDYRASNLRLRFWVEALRRRQTSKESAAGQRTAKMKFSHSIQFNAVPDWSAYYIAYSNLKKL